MTGGKTVGGIDQVIELTLNQLELTVLALALSLLIALPIGLYLGHRGTGELFAIAIGNAGRAIPELALIAFMAAAIGVGVLNLTIALAVLGIPPILTNAFVGIHQVDRATVDAARGMGMTEFEILRKVELPLAIPTLMSRRPRRHDRDRRYRDDRAAGRSSDPRRLHHQRKRLRRQRSAGGGDRGRPARSRARVRARRACNACSPRRA